MKSIQNIFIAAAFIFSLSSCGNDWLNLEPSTEIDSATGIKTLSDVEFALNGIYSAMQSSDAYSGMLIYYGDATGDDMQSSSPTKRCSGYYRFNWTRDSGPVEHWENLYYIITNANVVLENIDAVTTSVEQERANDYKGQALAIRALAYFDLVRIFGKPYTSDNGASLGVPLVLESVGVDSKPSRNTVAECYEQIISDLTEATNNMLSTDYNKGRINHWAAMSLLSRVYLYTNDNTNALATAEAVIAGAEADGYALWTNSEYATAWAADNSSSTRGEVLFEIVNMTTDSPGNESMGFLSSYDGYDDICLTASFYDILTEDPNDVRAKLISLESIEENKPDADGHAYINKYQPQDGEHFRDANIPLLRLSETYLIASEAAVKIGSNDKAVKYLDAIVNRANPSNTVVGETISVDRVLQERRKELVNEGHRMYDVLRNGQKIKRFDPANPNPLVADTKHNTNYMEYGSELYLTVLPIPKEEMNSNDNMVQNDGY